MGQESKCTRESWCLSMERMLEPLTNSHKKGISTVVVTSVTTGKSRLIGAAYKKAPNTNGVMLNHCPWCGEKILWTEEVPAAANVDIRPWDAR